jgi:cytochrome c oxidase assembly protein subunit 15
MRALAIISLALVLLLISLAAYLRLSHSGVGCTPWPECYGNIAPQRDAAALHERLIEDATAAKSWATPLHRLVATVLGLLVLSLNIFAHQQKRERFTSGALLSLTVFLATLGVKSGNLHSPAIVMGNLLGGFAMLGLLGWMVFRKAGTGSGHTAAKRLSALAMVMLGLQIAIGGLTSANFAASACRTFPDCHGSWLPGENLKTALDLTRRHVTGQGGLVLGGPERADIHKLHRLTAVATLVFIIAAGIAALRAGHDLRIIGIALILFVSIEFGVGVMAVLSDLPIALAVAHNALAALLLLGLLKLYAESRVAVS